MQVERTVDSATRVVLLRVSGPIADGELASLTSEVASAPGVTPDFSLLIDLRDALGGAVTGPGVRALSRQPLVLSPTSRRAVVVPSVLGVGMARMYELLREQGGGGVRVFIDYDEAKRWVVGD